MEEEICRTNPLGPRAMRRPLAALKCSRRERNLQHRRTNEGMNEPPLPRSLSLAPCFMIYSLFPPLSLRSRSDPASKLAQMASPTRVGVRPMKLLHRTIQHFSPPPPPLCKRTRAQPTATSLSQLAKWSAVLCSLLLGTF